MRLFTKIFLCSVLILSVSLSVLGYLMIADSFSNAMDHELDRVLSEYQMCKFSVQSGMLAGREKGILNDKMMVRIAENSVGMLPESSRFALVDEVGTVLYTSFSQTNTTDSLILSDDDGLVFGTVRDGEEFRLVAGGTIEQSGRVVRLFVGGSIASVIREKHQMQERFAVVLGGILGAGTLLVLVFSVLLTGPMKRLAANTRAFAGGDYGARARVKSGDEIGELAESFNKMADTVEGTIRQLAVNAQQKEDFVSNFSHELKTPLTSVVGYADMIRQRGNLSEAEVREAAETIVKEGLRLESLSRKMMDLIVLDRQDFVLVPISTEELAQDVERVILPMVRERKVCFRQEVECAEVRGERDLFMTLLLNLVDNAIKADSQTVTLRGESVGDSYVFSVSDDGCGIPADQLERITEAFYMVDPSRSRHRHGVGLGLTIAARIAKLHGAELVFESSPGVGTMVVFHMKEWQSGG